jgi:two-component system, NarL family, response regulator DevR
MKIFLVEDSLIARGRLAATLATIPGAQIVGQAASAMDAIRDILTLRPDLVLLDVHLAEGSGFDVLHAVHVTAPEIEFCMLSSFAPAQYRQLAVRLGAREFFDKREIERVRDLVARRVAAGRSGEASTPH